MVTKAERVASLIRAYKAKTSSHFRVLEEKVLHSEVEFRRDFERPVYSVILPGVEAIFTRSEHDPFWRLNSFSFMMFDHMANEVRYDTIPADANEEPFWYWTEPHIKNVNEVLKLDDNLPSYNAFMVREYRQPSPQYLYSGIRWEGQVKPRKKYRLSTLQKQLQEHLDKRGVSSELLQLETMATFTAVDPFGSAFV